MHQDTTGSTSRRTFVKCGLLSAGVFVGSTNAATGASSADRDDDPAATQTIDRGVMRPYQWTPDKRVTVDDVLEYRPARLDGPYRTYVVSYDHAPSYQAFLFVPDADDGGETDRTGTPLEAGDSLSIGQLRGEPSAAENGYVTVDLEPQSQLQ